MTLPDYDGGSIVNLMATLAVAFNGRPGPYSPLEQTASRQLPQDGHIVLLVIDGLGYHYLRQARGVSALQAGLRGAMTSVFPSTTATAVTAFMTGVAAQQHGLTGWHMHLDEVAQVVAILPFETREGGVALKRLGAEPATLFDYPTFYQRIDAESFAVAPDGIATSVFNRWHTRGATVQPYRSHTQFFEAIERLTRGEQRRRFIYAYLPDFDTSAHEHGAASLPTSALLQRVAQGFERLLRSLAGSGTTVVVTADHGFVDVPAAQRLELTDYPAVASCLAGPLTGERRLPYCHLKPGMEHRFETAVADALGHACTAVRSSTLIADHIFGLGDAHPQLAHRAGDYALLMHPGYTLKDWVPGEQPHALVGVHGGLTEDEMLVPLMVFET